MTIELPEPSVIGKHKSSGLAEAGYTRDQMLVFRDEVLEEAALVCDRLHGLRNDECADYIRALSMSEKHVQKSLNIEHDSAKIRAAFEDDDFHGVPV